MHISIPPPLLLFYFLFKLIIIIQWPVLIHSLFMQVDSSLKDLLGDSMPVINLNFPPSSGGSKSPQIIDVNVEPVVDGGLVEVNEPVKPIVKEHANKNQELNFPIDDNLLATNVVPGPVSPENNSSVSYPIIDLSDAAPISGVDKAALDQAALEEVMGKNDGVEQSLLKALDEMGFKCDAFNKEILRMHEYDLEETVNHLCGVGEWDPILEELKEMVSLPFFAFFVRCVLVFLLLSKC